MNFLAWLREKIKQQDWSAKTFMVFDGKEYTFSWLMDKTKELSQSLIKANQVKSRAVVALHGDYSPITAALLLALIENNNVIVPISTKVEEKVKYYLDVSQAEHLLLVEPSLCYKKLAGQVSNPLLLEFQKIDRPGLVLFTSGSTGRPKAAFHDFSILLENFMARTRKSMKTLVFLRLDHIGGINTFFSMISNGAMMVVLSDRTPKVICEMIACWGIEIFPTTPSFLNLLLVSEDYKEHDLSSLKLITYGTEVMSESLLKKLQQVFPAVRFKQTYGLTEVGILSTKSMSSDSTWVKVGGDGYQIKVVDGILWIKANASIKGYLNAPSPFNIEGWLITNDRVEVKDDYLKFLGREEEMINVGGLKVYPSEVEEVLFQAENIGDVVVFGEKNPILGNIVVAKVSLKTPEPFDLLRKRLLIFCQTKLERFKIPQKIIISEVLYNERFKKLRIADN